MSITLLASDMTLTVLWLVLVLGLATGRHSDSRCTANSSHCPTCYVPTAGNESSVPCECGIQNQRLVKCDQSNLTAHTLAGVCMTYNETEDSTAVGQCPYGGSSKVEGLHNHLPCNVSELNSFMCDGLNRMGQLCAHCKPGLGPAVLSFPGKCLECLDSRYGWLVFLAIGFLPMTFFCIFVVIFRIHAFSAPMNAFIFVCHYITNAIYLDPYLYTIVTQQGSNVLVPAHMVIAFYGFWNLDFFCYALPQFCLSEKLNSLQAIALEYIAAVYPPVFLILIYICIEWHDRGCTPIAKIWKPFRMCFAKFRRSWEIKGSVINAFATVVLLSFSKLFQISIGLITPLRVYKYYSNRTETVTALNYGENTPYFSSGHIPYFILVISVFFTFNMLPMLFLLLYTVKGFQQCLNRVLGRRVFFLNAFAEVFQGCYKNGIQSKSDCRYFAGMYLLFRVIFLVHYFTPFYYGALLQICISILIAVLFFTINPYSTHFYNLLDGFFFIMVAAAYTYIWFLIFINTSLSLIPVYISICLPFVHIILYFALKVLPHMSCVKALVGHTKARLHGSNREEETEESEEESEEDELPHRLEHPSEYSPLLPQASNPLPQETQEEAAAATTAAANTLPSHNYGGVCCTGKNVSFELDLST